MNLNSVICNLISSINVARKHSSGKGKCIYSTFAWNVLDKLKKSCIIDKFEVITHNNRKMIEFHLLKKYDVYLLIDIKVVSRPGQRIYLGHKDLRKNLRYYNDMLVSTNRGILNYKECKANKVGGEVILVYK